MKEKCFCGQKAAETVWVRSVCSKNPDDTELPALRSSNQIGILETIELHPRIIFTYSRIWFLSAILVFMSRLGIDSL